MEPEGTPQTAERILDKIAQLQSNIHEVEARTKEWVSQAKDEIDSMVREAIKVTTTPDERHHVARVLYWDFGKCAIAASALNLKAYEMVEYVGTWTMERQCSKCRQFIVVEFRSMSEFRNRLDDDRYICPVCITEKHNQWAAESRAVAEQRAEQAARYTAYVQQLKTMPYVDYLYTEHWQNTRQKALARAGFRCQACNREKHLHVHHRTYERRGEELPEDLTVLCAPCHKTFHENRKVQP